VTPLSCNTPQPLRVILTNGLAHAYGHFKDPSKQAAIILLAPGDTEADEATPTCFAFRIFQSTDLIDQPNNALNLRARRNCNFRTYMKSPAPGVYNLFTELHALCVGPNLFPRDD
jgi:hypothetical protein